MTCLTLYPLPLPLSPPSPSLSHTHSFTVRKSIAQFIANLHHVTRRAPRERWPPPRSFSKVNQTMHGIQICSVNGLFLGPFYTLPPTFMKIRQFFQPTNKLNWGKFVSCFFGLYKINLIENIPSWSEYWYWFIDHSLKQKYKWKQKKKHS